ncbi:response regulator [Pannus brasiliensis CCIBt3594]|uniref:Response regulator n=1 Tax=Pannus brasiliensis CCIBt3594 TaxID=1427578 RepID=A0AAW9QLJ0_9CHRO
MEEKIINILLVEDDEVDVMNVKRAFRKNNILNPLHVASNGLEALTLLRGVDGSPPELSAHQLLILLDLNMPKMGGLEFLQEIRADSHLKTIPVVILTTSNQDQDRMEAYQLNISGYILKPVTFSNFVETMATLNKYWTLCEMP